MEIDKNLVNSINDAVLDEVFDLKPVLPEIYLSQPPFNRGSSSMDMPQIGANSDAKQLGSDNYYTCTANPEIITMASSSSPKFISFGNSNQLTIKSYTRNHGSNGGPRDYAASPHVLEFSSVMQDGPSNSQYEMGGKTMTKSPSRAQDHLMSERKRREKLNQLFIALSKVVPGLKKLDKASLLEYAINYMKTLQEQVRVLEEEHAKRNSMLSSSGERVLNSANDHYLTSSSFKDDPNGSIGELEPEIKTRILNKNVLIKIFCLKQKGIISRISSELDKLHLDVLDIRATPFGTDTLDITVLAQMESKFSGTAKAIVEHLGEIFQSMACS